MKTYRIYFTGEILKWNVDIQAMDRSHAWNIGYRMVNAANGDNLDGECVPFQIVDVVEILSEKELTAIAESVE